MNYKGVIIEESLEDRAILDKVKILNTKVENVTPQHKTSWLTKWTLDTVEISEGKADIIADRLCKSLDKKHPWYADYKNEKYHYVIYRDKVFKVDLSDPKLYRHAKEYGISIGIPDYQVDFAPEDKIWQR